MNTERNDPGPPLLLRPEEKLGDIICRPSRFQDLESFPENVTLSYLDYEVWWDDWNQEKVNKKKITWQKWVKTGGAWVGRE